MEDKNSIESIMDNIKNRSEQWESGSADFYSILEKENLELKRLILIREKMIKTSDSEDIELNEVSRLQKKMVKLIVTRNSLELEFNNIKEDLNKAIYVKGIIENDIEHSRFVLIDTVKAEGIDIKNLKKLIMYLNEFEDKECQIILTSGYEEHLKDMDKFVVDRLDDDNKLLKRN